jgi:tRNA 5-methylaminomethyl-2-thiouridine biosynthesis bifunctional protein
LSWTDDGRPRSSRFDDIYFAPEGLDEARTVFLAGCGLPEAWTGRCRFTVAELGFGTGLNILALLQLWRETRPAGGRLHIFSVEAFPLSPDQARAALAGFPEVAALAKPLLARWPGSARGFARTEWPELGAVLDVATGEVADALSNWTGAANAWFLDGFAPSRNPEMWRPEVLDLVRERSAPGARIATFTVAGAVRRGLAERGFTVTRAAGHGRKKERLEARFPGSAAQDRARPRIAVVGAGIAGASLARAFGRLGEACVVIDPEPGSGASGNPVALVSPRLDAGGGTTARLYAQAYARAVTLYADDAPEAVRAQGALRLASGPKDPARFRVIADQDIHHEAAFTALDPAQASDRFGAACSDGLWMADALTVAPCAILDRWLTGAQRVRATVGGLERRDGVWRVLDGSGGLIAEADFVVLAAGVDTGRWAFPELLEPVRGQVSWTNRVNPPGSPASWGGYLLPLPAGGVLFGATHERGVTDADVRVEDDARNLATLAERLPELAAAAVEGPLSARASLRAATPDRLPLAGASADTPGLFVLSGLGGRGFTTAPLLAEHVAALSMSAPSPLPRDLAAVVDPARFEARTRRRSSRPEAAE